MIREVTAEDMPRIREIHNENGLPENCFPDTEDPLCIAKLCVERDGKPVIASFLVGTAEIFLILDHSAGTPEERWKDLQDLTAAMKEAAWSKGLNQFSAWIPPEIERSFSKRLEALGFQKSPWSCFTMPLA